MTFWMYNVLSTLHKSLFNFVKDWFKDTTNCQMWISKLLLLTSFFYFLFFIFGNHNLLLFFYIKLHGSWKSLNKLFKQDEKKNAFVYSHFLD
jgi:hypothetical protein